MARGINGVAAAKGINGSTNGVSRRNGGISWRNIIAAAAHGGAKYSKISALSLGVAWRR